MGKDDEGHMVFVVSKSMWSGLASARDILEAGLALGLKEAAVFDGGTSLDYGFDDGTHSCRLKALPNFIGSQSGYGNPSVYICADFE